MAAKRDRVLIGLLAGAFAGVVLLFSLLAWFLWRESVVAEERRIGNLARVLGERAEASILDARDMLDGFNRLDVTPCSADHLRAMQEAAVARPYIRAIGYWQADERLCGVGFVQGVELTPSRADRIYDSGVVAWWPGPQTRVGGVDLFVMRFGEHDVLIDPRLLLDAGPLDGQQAGLWVEGLPMTSRPQGSDLPEPRSIPPGLSVDRDGRRIVSRFSLGTLLPIDIVAVQPMSQFWKRYLPTLLKAALLGAALLGIWIYVVQRYSKHRLSLATELRAAIASKKITVAYQPIVTLESGRCVGAEALARWQRDDGEMVSPAVFIPVAEQALFVQDITLSVLERMLHDLGQTLTEHPDLRVNLNLSSQDLESEELPQRLARQLEVAGVPASAVTLEITERALIDSEVARRQIHNLRERGHQVAIDDFGTGYSSLSYLQTFELDTLKIDKAFVDAIETHAITSGVIPHVIEMARSLDLDMVAEGIESDHQVEWLRSQGVRFGQGILFGPPLSADDFLRFLRVNH